MKRKIKTKLTQEFIKKSENIRNRVVEIKVNINPYIIKRPMSGMIKTG